MPSIPRHPNLASLRRSAEGVVARLQSTAAAIRLDNVPTVIGEDGVRVAGADRGMGLLIMARETMETFGPAGVAVKYERDLRGFFPALATRTERARLVLLDRVRELVIFLGHMLGTDDPERLGVDMSLPIPDPDGVPRGPSVPLNL